MWNSQSMYKKTEKQRDFNEVISSLHNKAISIKLAKLYYVNLYLYSPQWAAQNSKSQKQQSE